MELSKMVSSPVLVYSFRVLLIHFIFAHKVVSTLAFATSSHSSSSAASKGYQEDGGSGSVAVSVFDNVIPSASQDILHVAASESGLGHKVFSRPIVNPEQSPVIELVLDAILTEMGDLAEKKVSDDGGGEIKQYVEYWTRQEFRHIEAHADVDEHLAKDQDTSIPEGKIEPSPLFRYPKNGHVLYLKIGSEVRGPTCVFPKISTGGQLIQKQQEKEIKKDVDLVVVPAVNGRLLRFGGDALHAVPRPADLWFLSFVRGAPEFKPEEKWGRSVILFNTWPGTEDPPKDVPMSTAPATTADTKNIRLVNERDDWKDVFSWNHNDNKTCNVQDDEEQVKKEEEIATSNVKIWLLGNERRRDYPMRTIKIKAKSSARGAFLESNRVTYLALES